MKEFIEAIEIRSDDNVKDFIKESSKEKIKEKLKLGKNYKYRKHTCYHDEKPCKPCTTEDLDGIDR